MIPDQTNGPWGDPKLRVAAGLRRLFRSFQAQDRRAADLCHSQLCDYIDNCLLNRHLLADPRWDRRTVDYVSGRVEIRPPNWYRISGGHVSLWLLENWDLTDAGSEPVEFEVELDPKTGELWRYVFRLGDPLRYEQSSEVESWAFVFREGERQSLFPTAPADRLEWTFSEQDAEPDFESDGEGQHNRFVDSLAEDLAALTREFFRDVEANDQVAADVSLVYLRHYLMLMVNVLAGSNADWQHVRVWKLAGSTPNFQMPIRFRIVDEIIENQKSQSIHVPRRELFEFDLELSLETSLLKNFYLKFGSQRPMELAKRYGQPKKCSA